MFRSRSIVCLIGAAALILAPAFLLGEGGINWAGDYAPCLAHSELLKSTPMRLGVRFSTCNPMVNRQFRRAMDFWAKVLDMSWHEEPTTACALQIVDGTPTILQHSIVARSQFTDWENFQGWIAFDSRAPLTKTETFLTAVHELGHTFGLQHNPSAKSVMYYIDLEGPEVLDQEDITALAQRHKLREPELVPPIPVNGGTWVRTHEKARDSHAEPGV